MQGKDGQQLTGIYFQFPIRYQLKSNLHNYGKCLDNMIVKQEQGPVVQKPINANPRLKINQGVYYSTTKCCSTLIFGKTLH